MSDPVSWFVIEEGWTVEDADGKAIGRVEKAIGDGDIFNGVVFSHGLFGSPRWVSSDDVEEITEGRIRLRLRGDQIKELEEYQEPHPA